MNRVNRHVILIIVKVYTVLNSHTLCFVFQYPVQGPFRTRLCTYIQGNFYTMFLQMLENVRYIHSLQDIDLGKCAVNI